MEDKQLLKKAKKKVKQKKDFYTHALVIAATSFFLLGIKFFANAWDDWGVLIPISAMILSVVIHYITVFGIAGFSAKKENWEADALKEEYLKLKQLEDSKMELLDEDQLRLKQLEKRYRDEDLV